MVKNLDMLAGGSRYARWWFSICSLDPLDLCGGCANEPIESLQRGYLEGLVSISRASSEHIEKKPQYCHRLIQVFFLDQSEKRL
jgi:hypothetical protein